MKTTGTNWVGGRGYPAHDKEQKTKDKERMSTGCNEPCKYDAPCEQCAANNNKK